MADYFPGLSPLSQKLVELFLQGYFDALTSLNINSQLLEDSANRRLLATLNPDVSKRLERRTKQEIEAEKPVVAIAAGVAVAIQAALESQRNV